MLLALGQNAFKQQMGAIQLEASNMQAAMPQRHCLMRHMPGVQEPKGKVSCCKYYMAAAMPQRHCLMQHRPGV